MIRISELDRYSVHKDLPAKRYARGFQRPRILLSRTYLEIAIRSYGGKPKISELGCGVLDISGPYAAEKARVTGYDFNKQCVIRARNEYKSSIVNLIDLKDVESIDCDILIACEVLEHMQDPVSTIKRLSKNAKYLIISHPINEGPGSKITNGIHCWCFSEFDFKEWFHANGFNIIESEYFDNGKLHSMIGIGTK